MQTKPLQIQRKIVLKVLTIIALWCSDYGKYYDKEQLVSED